MGTSLKEARSAARPLGQAGIGGSHWGEGGGVEGTSSYSKKKIEDVFVMY